MFGGGNQPGANRIHLNVVHAPFASQVLRENNHTAFTSAVADGGEFREMNPRSPATGSDVCDYLPRGRLVVIMTLPTALRKKRNVSG